MNIEKILESVSQLNDSDFVELAHKIDAQRQKRAQDIINKATAQAELLTGNKKSNARGSRTLPPKYADPFTGKTWSGQGRQPKWFAEYIAKGGEEKELLIK